MVAKYYTLVRETAPGPGTGDVSLNGASAAHNAFGDVYSDGDTLPYTIMGSDKSESGLGTYNASSNSLTRTTVISNTSGTTAKLDFTNTVTVSNTIIADGNGAVALDQIAELTTGAGITFKHVLNLDVALDVTEGGTGATTASGARTNLGLGSIATQDSNNVSITGGSISGITDLAVADGGTGASTASGARTNLGLAIGSDVQAHSARLDEISALAVSDGNFIVANGASWVAESGGTARASLGLGSIATQSASSVSITGGSISGITDLAVADGGTGASTASAARSNLGLGSIATQDASSVSITGGAIDGTTIGGSTPASGTFTGVTIDGGVQQFRTSGGASVTARVTQPTDGALFIDADSFGNFAGSYLALGVDGAEAARLDDGGNFLVSTTDTNPSSNSTSGSEGIALSASGQILSAAYQSLPAAINRMGDDGQIVQVRRDGSSVGALSAYSSTFTLEDLSGNGINFRTGGSDLATLSSSGLLSVTRDGGISGNFTRNTSDGDILAIDQGGTQVGALGSTTQVSQHFVVGPSNGNSMVLGNSNVPILVYRPSATAVARAFAVKSDVGSTFNDNMRVFCDGDVTNTNNSYGALSDESLKENIVSASSQWSDVKALGGMLKNFNVIGNDLTQLGLIAQDAMTVSPGLVKDDGDGYYSLAYSVLGVKTFGAVGELLTWADDTVTPTLNNHEDRLKALEAA